MTFANALLLADLDQDLTTTATALRRLAPELSHVLVVATSAAPEHASRGRRDESDDPRMRALDRLRQEVQNVATECDVEFAFSLDRDSALQLARDARIDLLVASTAVLRHAPVLAEVHRALSLPILCPAHHDAPNHPIEAVLCVPLGRAGRASVAAFLRQHGDPKLRVTLLAATPSAPDALSSWLDVAMSHAATHLPLREMASLRRLLADDEPRPDFDLLVLTRVPVALLLGIAWPTPVVLLPTPPRERKSRRHTLDVPDVVNLRRSNARPLTLYDCEVGDDVLRRLQRSTFATTTDLWAVRLRGTTSVSAIRERLHLLRLPSRVMDARAVLDEGPALDVSDAFDAIRLRRVATRLQRAGVGIAGIVHPETSEPQPHVPNATTTFAGNHVEFELDNATARRWLLDAIASSQRTILLQVYMAADDDVGRAVEVALAAAGVRGVIVRVLVDSLHGLHGSFGVENPLLERLSRYPGVALRTCQPLRQLPSLADLKQRDHRKLLVVDDHVALVGGRNLSHEYYAGFDEVRINATSPWRELPWLDAGARVNGPVVTALCHSFHKAWTEAGGEPFVIPPTPTTATPGPTTARVVVHHGLQDAATLEAYLELIDNARSHIYAVNGFPLLLELQHALLRAHRRGVHVQVLTGHPGPTYSGAPFPGPWSTARVAATELVHSRLDPLVEAGIDVYSFAIHNVPDWDADLGIVHPHVHAKVLSVDGQRFTVGSANFDVTASYWESELLLVVEDAVIARRLEATINTLLTDSTHWSRDDATWQRLATRRSWMRHWPGVLSL